MTAIARRTPLFGPRCYISVRVTVNGGYDVAVWDREQLAAWGHTASEHDVIETLRRCQDGLLDNLLGHQAYLIMSSAVDPAPAVEAQWHLLLTYGDEYLRRLVSTAATSETLRRLRPWVSHGTLHLLHSSEQLGSVRRGLAFHPADGSGFTVRIYDGAFSPRLDDAEAATAFAAQAAESW